MPAAFAMLIGAQLLGEIARQLNPIHSQLFRDFRVGYYWSVYQSEWATDVAFRSGRDLDQLYPRLIHHAMRTFDSREVMLMTVTWCG